ncbi:hypothetical protein A1O1_06262 [Capronia coronata CBS 617.96]|uniref:Uncharacterized protein n=1 Tax=Capronia coronata CBS 617.96 TaxID=1182541 RepID=W9Y0B1_9EURO|nr:uncharacterized protein A1O1_06262 [Capronia coronata CBS 617.96]EXJ85893.1 hypothetical protein A1O1_06262 [Capronia coronata CBS 617.96]
MVDPNHNIILVILDPLDDLHDMLHATERRCDRHFGAALPCNLDRRLLGMLRPMRHQLQLPTHHDLRLRLRHHDRYVVYHHDTRGRRGVTDPDHHEQRPRHNSRVDLAGRDHPHADGECGVSGRQ